MEPVRVDRETFVQKISEASPGLSASGIIDQSKCFVFKEGQICTFNEEIACRTPSGLPKNFRGAVQAKKMTDLLQRMKGRNIGLLPKKNELIIIGKNEAAGLVMETTVLLPIDNVENPGEWEDLSPDFADAVSIVSECASSNRETFSATCIHLHPKWMEAYDTHQMTRYRLQTGVKSSFLVRKDAIKHVPGFDFTEFSQTEKWVHFKTSTGTVMSCRRYIEEMKDFSNLSPLLKIRGQPTILPKSLGDAAEKGEIFSKDEGDDNMVLVNFKKGVMTVKGKGAGGWYKKKIASGYKGGTMQFMIAPKLLIELLKRHTECELGKMTVPRPDGKFNSILRIDGGKFRYAVCLEAL